jgi:hypothetical protein
MHNQQAGSGEGLGVSTRKRHTRAEVAAKLAQANDLEAEGKLQRDIAHTLGISVMTLHRWRKAPEPVPSAPIVPDETARLEQELGPHSRIDEIQLENSRLRRLVTDLLLEKMELEEAISKRNSSLDNQRPRKTAG